MIPVQAFFTVPIPDIYRKFNDIYVNLEKAGVAPWRSKTGGTNHCQLWFELENETDIETIKDLIPKDGKVFFIDPWSQYN